MVIDSGAPINTVTERDWETLISSKAMLRNAKDNCSRVFRAYAAAAPLRILKTFEAVISVHENKPSTYAEFFVIEGARNSLLSKETAEEMKVLKVGLDVQAVCEGRSPFPKFPGVLVRLEIDRSVVPKKSAFYRIPAAVYDSVTSKLQEMLANDIVEMAPGPVDWISPLLVVPKGKGDVRLCVDMRKPNKAIKREHYPLPTIETYLNQLRDSSVFSKIDISSAYHHVELDPESRDITTFMTPLGLMRYKRLMFGVNCAPEIFQRIMEEMLAGCPGVVVFIDDIGVTGKDVEEHDQRLRKVLSILKANNATLNKDKCKFGVKKLDFLGFTVSEKGIEPSQEKIQAIENFRQPQSVEEVRSFLGLVQFVGHFIEDLATKAEPLRQVIRSKKFEFKDEQQRAFDQLRMELTVSVRKLGFFDPKDETNLYADASPVGLGAVLIQVKNDQPRIISFASKSLTETERKYPQTQREALALVWAIERFYFYLFGLHFKLLTDHETLKFIFEGKHQNGKRACTRAESWALRLQPYDFEVVHIPGKSNIADSLSRLCLQVDDPFEEDSETYLCKIGESETAITLDEIEDETAKDDELQSVAKASQNNDWPDTLINYRSFSDQIGMSRGIVVRNDRIILPTSLRRRALEIVHRGHPGVIMMKRIIRDKLWWPGLDKDVEDHARKCLGCIVVSRENPPEPMCRKRLPDEPWQEIAIDYLEVRECDTSFLVVVDYYSRYVIVEPVKETNAKNTIEALQRNFDTWGYPEQIRADNGQPFASAEFKEYCLKKNVKIEYSIPYWPQMNGEVERQNRGLVRALKIGKVEKQKWRDTLKGYVSAYNRRPHSTTDKSPLEIMTNRKIKDLIPTIKGRDRPPDDEIREQDALAKEKGRRATDKKRRATEAQIEVGDKVFVRNKTMGKLEPNFKPNVYEVIDKKGNETWIRSTEGVRYRRCVTDLKKWEGEEGRVRPGEPQLDIQAQPTSTDMPKDQRKDDTNTQMQRHHPRREVKRPSRFES